MLRGQSHHRELAHDCKSINKSINNTVLKRCLLFFWFLNFGFYTLPIPNLLLLCMEDRGHRESKSLFFLIHIHQIPPSASTLSFSLLLGQLPTLLSKASACLSILTLSSVLGTLTPLATFSFFCIFRLSLHPVLKSLSLSLWEKSHCQP